MPKIIKGIEETIKNCAIQLFIEYGYNKVDMKMISEKSEVAVGTLYNYYKNKRCLYINILEESWQNTFYKLDDIHELTISSKEKMKKLITVLYEDIEARNGLGKDLVNTSSISNKDDDILNLRKRLLSKLEELIAPLNKIDVLNKHPNINLKLIECLLPSIIVMLEAHPNNKEENINFLVEFMNLSVK